MSTTTEPVNSKIAYDDIEYDVVREGLAEILNPVKAQSPEKNSKGKSEAQSVFYNPIQQFNRDLSVLAIRVFAEHTVELRSQKHGKRKTASDRPNKKRKIDEANGIENGSREDRKQEQEVKTGQSMEDGNKAKNTLQNGQEETKPEDSSPKQNDQKESNQEDSIPKGPRIPPREPTKKKFRILDALSASGLRALRYAKEIPEVTDVVANDLSHSATEAIRVNIKHNKQGSKITPNTGNAIDYMHSSKDSFEVVDLDPYGTAGPFLDAAVQSVTNDGLLCVTCTDSAVFAASGYSEKTFAVYGGMPVKGPHSHEGGLRLLLSAIATSAAKYGRAIEPLLSLSIDFYIRVFVKVRASPAEVKFLASKTMIVYGCDSGCGSWTTQPIGRSKSAKDKNDNTYHIFTMAQAPSAESRCPHCGFATHLHGPMWAGPIHNPYFVQNMLDTLIKLSPETYGTKARMEGMLTLARDEILINLPEIEPKSGARIPPELIDSFPFFFLPSSIASVLHCNAPSTAHLRGALLRLGYKVTRSHAKPGSLKTNAPWTVLWEIMREWIRIKSPIKEENIKPGMPARQILDQRREWRNSLSSIRDELRALSENSEAGKHDFKTNLESMLFRLSHPSDAETDLAGEEENAPDAFKRELPVHKLKIVFDEALGKKSEEAEGKKMVRYQMNPTKNWGPLSKAKP